MLHESGLAPIIELIETCDVKVSCSLSSKIPCRENSQIPLSHVPAAAPQEIVSALRAFDTFLSELDVVSSPQLALLTVPRLATLIHRSALKELGNHYEKICVAIKDPKNRYEFASTLLGGQRPFGQMDVLWQVMGVEDLI